VATFLALCGSSGKKQLIIDVRGNPGGTAYLACDIFKRLFPDQVPYTGVRARLSDAASALGTVASDNLSVSTDAFEGAFFEAQAWQCSPDGPYYSTWQELSGPNQLQGDLFSIVASRKFFNATKDSLSSSAVVVSGYEGRKDIPPPIFSSENITLVSHK